MDNALGLFWSLWLVATLGWLLGTLWPYVSLHFVDNSRLSPASRARRVLILAALPWLLPVILVALVNAVPLLKASHWVADHCRYHSHGHLHACDAIAGSSDFGYINITLTGLIIVSLLTSFLRLARREWQMRRRLLMLSAFAQGKPRVRVVDDRRPFALAAGIHNRFVLLSRGLLQQLSRREKRVVLAHEFAHLRHADPLRNLLFECLLTLHLPQRATALRRVWQQALEERADDAAVARFGRDAVASTLLQVIRASRSYHTERCSAVGANALQRIQRLLAAHERETHPVYFFEGVHLAGLLAVAALTFFHHHTLETWVAWVAGI